MSDLKILVAAPLNSSTVSKRVLLIPGSFSKIDPSIERPDAAVLVDVLNPTSNRCPLRGGEGRVDSVGDNPIGPVVSFGQYLKCNDK